jgi:hypothetical protein
MNLSSVIIAGLALNLASVIIAGLAFVVSCLSARWAKRAADAASNAARDTGRQASAAEQLIRHETRRTHEGLRPELNIRFELGGWPPIAILENPARHPVPVSVSLRRRLPSGDLGQPKPLEEVVLWPESFTPVGLDQRVRNGETWILQVDIHRPSLGNLQDEKLPECGPECPEPDRCHWAVLAEVRHTGNSADAPLWS